MGYSNDPEVRKAAASGGIVSEILVYLLESGSIDGAMVSRLKIERGDIAGESIIAVDRNEILSSGGSIYSQTSSLPISEIKSFKGRVAVVGLPCDLRIYNRLSEKDKVLDEKTVLRIGLFCGHNSRKDLIRQVLERKEIVIDEIQRFRFRRGKWRGNVEILLKSGDEIRFPFSHFSIYQNLHFFSQRKCIFCKDHTAELADVSCGDAWLRHLKNEPIKHSVFIGRTKRGDDVIRRLTNEGRIAAENLSPRHVFASQKRSLIHHKSIRARARAARWFGYHIAIEGSGRDRWNDYLAAMITAANIRWSESKKYGSVVFKIPRPVLFMYLLLFKLLTNF